MQFRSSLMICSLIVAALSFVQCSSSSNSPSNKTGDAGSGAAGCQTYCDAITANCTGGDTSSTSNQQYSDKSNCLAVCALFPVGAASDTSGDTLGCRTYHANAAAGSAANAALHCPHAGPSGDGVCGDVCTSYCRIAEKFCVGTSQVYTSDTDCMATCTATPADARFNVSIQGSNERACLVYHAQEVALGGTNPAEHCLGDLAKQADPAATGGSVTCH